MGLIASDEIKRIAIHVVYECLELGMMDVLDTTGFRVAVPNTIHRLSVKTEDYIYKKGGLSSCLLLATQKKKKAEYIIR